MGEYLKKQIENTKGVILCDEFGNILDSIDGVNTVIIKPRNIQASKKLLKFVFEDYLINPFNKFDFHNTFNKGVSIPLKVMQGTIERVVGKMYYIKVFGYYHKSPYCNHCLKACECATICDECFRKLNVNDVEDVYWEGFVPINSCKEIVEL